LAQAYRRDVQSLSKGGLFKDRLDKPLDENKARPRRDRLRLTRVWDRRMREDYDGSYAAVRRYALR
jgi:hypothetical protein